MGKIKTLIQKGSGENYDTEMVTVANYLNRFMCLDIPDFQSPFRWTKEKAEPILESVIANLEKNYPEKAIFNMVQLFLYKGEKSSDRRYILDGFQRTATILILLCAIRDLLSELGNKGIGVYSEKAKELASSINYLYINVNTPDGERCKLQFNDNSELLKNYIFSMNGKKGEKEFSKEDKRKKTYTVENSYKVYKHFLKELRKRLDKCQSSKEEYDLLYSLQRSLLHESTIVVNDYPNATKEWVIDHFIKTNEGVATLRKQTLVKSHLLDSVRTEHEEAVVSMKYDQVLSKFTKDGDINTLLKYYFASVGEDVSVNRIPSEVKKYIINYEMTPEDFVSHLEKKVEHFSCYFNPQPDGWGTVRLCNIVSSLIILKVKQMCPIFIAMREEVENPKLQEKLAEWLLKVNVVRSIYGLNPNELTPAVIKVVKKFKNTSLTDEETRITEAIQTVKEEMMPKGVTIEEFRGRINGPIYSNSRSNVLLRMVEWEKSEDEVYFPLPKNVSLEHIQPKSLDQKWKKYLFPNEEAFSEEEWEFQRELLGNKALMDNKRNKQERLNSFEKKQEYYRKSIFKTTRELGWLSRFTEREREARQEQLVDDLCDIFIDVFEESKKDNKSVS